MRKLYIQASNVHQGGGKTLLESIIKNIDNDQECIVYVDRRLEISNFTSKKITLVEVAPNPLNRFMIELSISRLVTDNDTLLCFGNLPPLFKLRCRVVLFLQNKFLIENLNLNQFSLITQLRVSLERMWLKLKLSNVDRLIVQSPSMKNSFLNFLKNSYSKSSIKLLKFANKIEILPFFDNGLSLKNHKRNNSERYIDFVYVASGDPHKNHKRLIEAWRMLARDGIFPNLYLTVDCEFYKERVDWMAEIIEKNNLQVTNLGSVCKKQINELYEKSNTLIYPSKFESFGLPLLEAKEQGLKVIAPELDYVRDLINPDEVFDPESSISIYRSVKRFLGINDEVYIHTAKDFLNSVLKDI